MDVLWVASVRVTDDQPCTAEESPHVLYVVKQDKGDVAGVHFFTLSARICFDLYLKYWERLKLVWMLFLFFILANKMVSLVKVKM